MNQLLQASGEKLITRDSGRECKTDGFIGSGSQGEVYKARLDGKLMALKWYSPNYLKVDSNLQERLTTAIRVGRPNENFLWPEELLDSSIRPGFGYIMPLRQPRFREMLDWMNRNVSPTFSVLATVGYKLADSFNELHSKGFAYKDISFSNIFFDPHSGDIAICDNDNVGVDGSWGAVSGTVKFMAPEIWQGKATPNIKTDRYSLAVLLFYLFHIHHPLDGRRLLMVPIRDEEINRKLYGSDPLFIFDPNDMSNQADPKDPEAGANAYALWAVYPQFLRDAFTRAFTDGLNHEKRVTETEWKAAMIRLRDSIALCPDCGQQYFFDSGRIQACINPQCAKPLPKPLRIQIVRHGEQKVQVIMIKTDTRLFAHHIDVRQQWDFINPIAEVYKHPTESKWGLRNLSSKTWTCRIQDGEIKPLESGKTISLTANLKIQFPTAIGEILL